MRLTYAVVATAAALACFTANAQENSANFGYVNTPIVAKDSRKASAAAKEKAQVRAKEEAQAKATEARQAQAKEQARARAKQLADARAKEWAAAKADAKTETTAEKTPRLAKSNTSRVDLSASQPNFGIDRTKTASIPKVRPDVTMKERSSGKKTETAALSTKAAPKGAYGSIIARYAAAYGVPVSLAHAVIRVESNYRANARGAAGEVGLMQIKPATARGLGYSGSAAGLFNPETNIKYGMKYLGMAHKLGGGSTCGTILKYNAGHGAKRMNPVSANYCAKVKRHLGA